MADKNKYDKAWDLAEKSLKKAVDGDPEAAERLMQEAMASDEKAVLDVLRSLDETPEARQDPHGVARDMDKLDKA
jgi:hypothetical protein